jgi:hypothetical protein
MCTSTKRNKLQIYRLDRTNINLIHEISVQDPLISIVCLISIEDLMLVHILLGNG